MAAADSHHKPGADPNQNPVTKTSFAAPLRLLIVRTTGIAAEALQSLLEDRGALGSAIEQRRGTRLVRLQAYFPADAAVPTDWVKGKLAELHANGVPVGPAEVRLEPLRGEDWAESWKQALPRDPRDGPARHRADVGGRSGRGLRCDPDRPRHGLRAGGSSDDPRVPGDAGARGRLAGRWEGTASDGGSGVRDGDPVGPRRAARARARSRGSTPRRRRSARRARTRSETGLPPRPTSAKGRCRRGARAPTGSSRPTSS